ncbi:MAG: DUF5011 domain-containing protein [Acholeplasma sp.]|jgi:hypothetical protein|nr:MAG: DUF5011 domain-containing protein [Acholeplasma sp.]
MKFPKRFLVVVTLLLASVLLFACEGEPTPVDANPTFGGVGAVSIDLYDEFDPEAGVTATDAEDGNLTGSVVVKTNDVDNTVVGTYTVVYEVTDSAGNVVTATRVVTVNALDEQDYPLAQYLSGVDLSKLPAEDKAILFAAAESYLLENVYGGVPLYTRASRVMYSPRVQLFSPEYNGVLGFGTAFSQFSADDSTVLMYGDTYGQANEYTWRASFNTDPTSLNPWNADDSNTATFTDHFNGALYDFFFDDTKTGYEILPSLAKSEPIPVDPEVINGKTYAKVWRIELKDDLQWKFHPDTDVSGLPAGYEDLDASDYLWTWQYALENDWFRARTGGGDFVSQGIKNAAEFLNGTATWDQVGLRLAEGTTNTIELEYVIQKSTFDIKYGFAGAVLTPINQELFEALGEDYGLTPTDVASSGVYYFDSWTPGQLLTFKKNELHPDADTYKYTGYQYRYVNGSDNIFAEFLAGRLESAAVPASQVTTYANDPRVKTAPDATTWRLMINMFGSEENRDAYIAEHPEVGLDETWVPEPILEYLPFRQALYYGFDRYYAAVELVQLYLPAHTLFAPTYFLDGESGLSVRGTDVGQAVVDDFGGDSNGYFPDAAVDLFKQAVAEAIADGHYDAGTAENYTVITLELYWASSGNTSAQAMVANLKEQYETLLVDDVNFVRIVINVNDVAFPGNYYDYMMVAKMDLGIGGISGSLLDAPSFLDVFSDDNRGGFTLNWGIDTSTANIPVAYNNLEGKTVYEKWSFNALIEALTGKVYVKNGGEQVAWDNQLDLINAYLDMTGEVLESTSDGSVIAEYILGDTLANIAADEGFDSLVASIVVTESGKNVLYVISSENNQFSLFDQFGLATTADEAIQNYIFANYGNYNLTEALGPLTDAEIAANAYISGSYPALTTVALVAEEVGAPAEFVEVYATTWAEGWSDAVVVLHIGEYYVGWYWL